MKDWGYKDIAECEWPYYYKVPASFLKAAPVTNQGWRDSVLARTLRLSVGDRVSVYGTTYTVTGQERGRVRMTRQDSGGLVGPLPYIARRSECVRLETPEALA